MAFFEVYNKEKSYRPVCLLTLHSDMVGNIANSNFADYYKAVIQKDASKDIEKDITFTLPAFSLTEMPEISFAADLGPNGGAKLADKLKDFKEGQILGINVGEIVQNNNLNNNQKFVPSMVLGPNSFRVVKGAKKINMNLKTRIPYHPGLSHNLQPYIIVLESLMKLTMPTDAHRLTVSSLVEGLDNFVGGMDDTIEKLTKAANINFSELEGAVKLTGGVLADAARAIGESDVDKLKSIRRDIANKSAQIDKNAANLSDQLDSFLGSVCKTLIYREWIQVNFSRNSQNILTDYSDKNFKFLLKNFTATQSNQLYLDTLMPLWIDFEISLESLGVVVSKTFSS